MKNSPGFIERISSDRRELSGWAMPTPDGNFYLNVFLGELKLASSASLSPRRHDLPFNARAFKVRTKQDLPLSSLLDGSLTVRAANAVLPASRGLKRRETEALSALTVKLNASSSAQRAPGLVLPERTDTSHEISRVPFPVGTRSADGSAFIGHEGHLFLRTGSNQIINQYLHPKTADERRRLTDRTRAWISIIQARENILDKRGVRFVQLVQPEKSSVLSTGDPIMTGLTPALTELEQSQNELKSYVSGARAFSDELDLTGVAKEDFGLRLDSHLGAPAMQAFARAIIFEITPDYHLPWLVWDSFTSYEGDLALRFFGATMSSLAVSPDLTKLGSLSTPARLVSQKRAYEGHSQIGRQAHWHNPGAPIEERVLLFGSSSASRNSDLPHKLSWWMSRLFRDYKFVWVPYLDYSIINDFKPSVVIHQTVEIHESSLTRPLTHYYYVFKLAWFGFYLLMVKFGETFKA